MAWPDYGDFENSVDPSICCVSMARMHVGCPNFEGLCDPAIAAAAHHVEQGR